MQLQLQQQQQQEKALAALPKPKQQQQHQQQASHSMGQQLQQELTPFPRQQHHWQAQQHHRQQQQLLVSGPGTTLVSSTALTTIAQHQPVPSLLQDQTALLILREGFGAGTGELSVSSGHLLLVKLTHL
jgi:hypothetical protein